MTGQPPDSAFEDVPAPDQPVLEPEAILDSIDLMVGQDPSRRLRVRKRRYFFYFVLFTLLFSIGSVQVLHEQESGFFRLQRLSQRGGLTWPSNPLPMNPPELSRELGVPITEVMTAENVFDRMRSRGLETSLGPLDWNLRAAVGSYTVVLSYRIFLNMGISAIIAVALYLRARDKKGSQVIDRQNKRLRELNVELEKKVQEAERYLEELREAQTQLLQSEKLASIGRMSATLAHEIRNPMSIIMSAAGLASEDLPPGSPPQQAIDLIRQEITRLDQIITELLNFARPKPPRLEMHHVNALLRSWIPRMREELEKDEIEVEDRLASDLRQVKIDADQLYQVFLNVVWNARDAVRENGGGVIEISTEEAGPHGVFLTIRDDGSGMD
ncbi:hypothetical protein HZA57_03505, partial [Candidatus Poribacteria bacterium]|nr:hypothetical protein [Candidatus Poribacteria bacterium]